MDRSHQYDDENPESNCWNPPFCLDIEQPFEVGPRLDDGGDVDEMGLPLMMIGIGGLRSLYGYRCWVLRGDWYECSVPQVKMGSDLTWVERVIGVGSVLDQVVECLSRVAGWWVANGLAQVGQDG